MDYQAIARLGRGGMGVVDLARDAEGRDVALKRLTLHGSASEITRARQRLLREADVLQRLHHPNIVRLIEVIDDGDEIVLVMPYLAGGNLAERVTQHGPAPPADVELLGERLLGALAAAHQAGIIHRDIKPANVLYDSSGEPMLADFGLAHSRDQTQGLTVTGMVVGTPGYMPPEQARDEALTPASDIFSLGATLLFAATGHGPYGTGDPSLLMVRSANDEVERLPNELPKAMRGWLSSMLDPKPENRPTAVALLTGHGLPPRKGGKRQLLRPRNLIVFATATALVAGGFLLYDRESSSARQPAEANGSEGSLDDQLAEPPDQTGTAPEVPPADELPPGPTSPGELIDVVTGEFKQGGEHLRFVLPPQRIPEGPCDAMIRIDLDVTDGIVADLQVRDIEDRLLAVGQSRDGEPASVLAEQRVCPEPGEALRVDVILRTAPLVDPGQPFGSYVLTRELA